MSQNTQWTNQISKIKPVGQSNQRNKTNGPIKSCLLIGRRGICYFYYRNEHQIFLIAGIPVAPSMPSMLLVQPSAINAARMIQVLQKKLLVMAVYFTGFYFSQMKPSKMKPSEMRGREVFHALGLCLC